MKKNLVLTGMMGSGKSTIGKSLSQTLNLQFADVDTIIESNLSLTISEIFKVKGEDFFRKLELEESLRLIGKRDYVISLGGGAFMNKELRKLIKKNCFSVWLDLDIKKLFDRTKKNQKRPLLNRYNSLEELNKLYEDRKIVYSTADLKIDCNLKNKNEIVEDIRKIYENS